MVARTARLLALLACAFSAAVTPPARADDPEPAAASADADDAPAPWVPCHERPAPANEAPWHHSRSVGWPWSGALVGSVLLRESDLVRYTETDRPSCNFWGTSELVGLVQRAAARVGAVSPGARLTVGELSRRGGRNIPGHRSHENGRDVDIGFYLRGEAGAAVLPERFVTMRGSGRGSYGGPVSFDRERNWLLVEALVTDAQTPVQHIFVARSLRRLLVREGERRGASPELLAKVSRIVLPPESSNNPHRNHFHVRIYCPSDDVPYCRDRGPYWPWLPESHPFFAHATHIPGWPPRPTSD